MNRPVKSNPAPLPLRDRYDDARAHQQGIRAMFDRVAPRYDLMNDLMSGGIHRLWKRRCVALLAPAPGDRILDVAGGTGDLARLIARRGATAIVCDPSLGMMGQGRNKDGGVRWVAGAGEALPFGDACVTGYSVAFGLRNMSETDTALGEAFRVLMPGGRFVCLEFSTAAWWLAPFYQWYSDHIIPLLGALVAGQRSSYRYLVESIRQFPDQDTLAGQLRDVGFQQVRYRNLFFGIAAIHTGIKP